MSALFYGISVFLSAFLIHFIIWKIKLPKKSQTTALLKIFFLVFMGSIFILINIRSVPFFGITPPQTLSDYLQFFLLYSSLTLAYIVSYSAVEADSPSLAMILNIAKVSPDGLNKKRLSEVMTDNVLVRPRVRDLVNSKMIYRDKDKYKLEPKGIFLVNIFIFFRRLLNLPKGG